MNPLRIGLYNRYWVTGGGGERHAAAVANALGRWGDVEILTDHHMDFAALQQRLGISIGAAKLRRLATVDDVVAEELSAEYDLFVNATYMSTACNRARLGLYVLYFPLPTLTGASPASAGEVRLGTGFSFLERRGSEPYRWFRSPAELQVPPSPVDRSVALRLRSGVNWVPHVDITIDVAGTPSQQVRVGRSGVEVAVAVPASAHPTTITLRGRRWRAAGLDRGDTRELSGALTLPFDTLAADGTFYFPATYDRVVAISEYTRTWTKRSWGNDPAVLFPPVDHFEPGPKEQVIVGVGRFFKGGHSKKQVEMVRAFAELHRRQPGWKLVLLGGCNENGEAYHREVLAAAAGLPVEVHTNVSRETLASWYARATFFWHLAGLGEDEELHPVRQEHFGITTVEAMSAGCVPIVFGGAGQAEIVEEGISGHLVGTTDELVQRTEALAARPDLVRALSAAATTRARAFDMTAFEQRLDEIMRPIVGART